MPFRKFLSLKQAIKNEFTGRNSLQGKNLKSRMGGGGASEALIGPLNVRPHRKRLELPSMTSFLRGSQMKLRVFSDSTAAVDTASIVENLNRVAPSFTWLRGESLFDIKNEYVESPDTYKLFSSELKREIAGSDLSILFTEKPYDNNYFFESTDRRSVIVSMYGWEHLTTLPKNNGAVYFIAALLTQVLGIGSSHASKNTGCINDFLGDKTGIDAGMRSAFICTKCNLKGKLKDRPESSLLDIQSILDHLSKASRADEDICDLWSRQKIVDTFDVFLCHSSQDKIAVRELNERLKREGIRTWLDEEQLPPGRPWQELLEKQIEEIGAVAIIVGESGIGPWQDMELRAFIYEFVKRKSPVIPVILSDCTIVPKLPLFLSQFTWVDFRKTTPPPSEQIIWGITGKKPRPR